MVIGARQWQQEWGQLRDDGVAAGLTVSDAQGWADARMLLMYGVLERDVIVADPHGWLEELQRRGKM